ncbi:helix-turn-helix domain-containing protein [Caulobacter sp. SLTY]|uniref:XRE family transcriptional regulator n=1 Tax=Caulobacter sp. SLTY TaxID=2683262 RepID=UPI001411F977|nr:LexA family transcriptional regulator [Caulobacter sp. SLTY]NBB17005.1 helix-turn-helix domain-containing protein [Caulobacter sp. SLTY]
MNEPLTLPDFDYAGFGQRLAEAISPEKLTAFAQRAGVPQPTVSKYVRGQGTAPRLDLAARLAEAADCTLEWLVWGKGDGPISDASVIRLPRYAGTLAAGAGSWNEGRQLLDYMPFTSDFLRQKLNRTSTKGLVVLEAKGDSMFPTIHDGELLVVDEDDTRIVDGILAFVLDGDARVKRFRKRMDGITLISDNPAYEPEEVAGATAEKLQIIGRPLLGLQVF